MKEVKTFFSQGNTLNKGYAADKESLNNDNDNYAARRKMEQNLSAIDLIIAYEEAHPGTFEKLLKMTEKEQTHRHNAELINFQMNARASAMGRLFGFFTICAICYTTINIAYTQISMNDTMTGALIFAALAFLSIFGVSLIAYKRTSNRFHNDRRRGRDHFQLSNSSKNQANFAEDTDKKVVNDNHKFRYNNQRKRRR